jgi:hypothetical protein
VTLRLYDDRQVAVGVRGQDPRPENPQAGAVDDVAIVRPDPSAYQL